MLKFLLPILLIASSLAVSTNPDYGEKKAKKKLNRTFLDNFTNNLIEL